MFCEVEAPLQTEVRLRSALRTARAKVLPKAYMWQPCASLPQPAEDKDEPIAMARSDQGWCQLAPANGAADGEKWALISLEFDSGAQIDGFLDWFASRLRRRVHPRLIVANGSCGPSHFAFWGVPERHRDALGRELSILVSRPSAGACGVGLI